MAGSAGERPGFFSSPVETRSNPVAPGAVLARGHRSADPRPVAAGGAASGQDSQAAIERAQKRLRELPSDWQTWAGLGQAYVEQARVTGDPSYYAKAAGALDRSSK